MQRIDQTIMNAVVEIGIHPEPDVVWIGTGIQYGDPIPKSNECGLYLFTNRHVIEEARKAKADKLTLRFFRPSDRTMHVRQVPLNGPDGKRLWMDHKNSKVDVAVLALQFGGLLGNDLKFGWIGPLIFQRKADLLKFDIHEGEPVFVIGYPHSLFYPANTRAYPVVRSGIVARISDLHAGDETAFLIDATVYPGNSGGPVLIPMGQVEIGGKTRILRSVIIGMATAYWPYEHEDVEQAASSEPAANTEETETAKEVKRLQIVYRENSSLAIVETVDSMFETLELLKQWLDLNIYGKA